MDNSSSSSSAAEDELWRLAVDIGGSLIKVVYCTNGKSKGIDSEGIETSNECLELLNGSIDNPVQCGRLHFAKFETSKINDCLDFIGSKKLQSYDTRQVDACAKEECIIKATGGGAYMFTNLFKEKLGITLEKVEEMGSLVAGANFLLKAVNREAFTYIDGHKEYIEIDHNDLYPYLLVNIGSGVSMIKVDGDNSYERVSGTSVGGGTFWGLGRLLTKCKSFDELLDMSHKGNNRAIDMLVGDIYGGMDYTKVGLTSTAIASSFGKAMSANKELEDYSPEDVSRSLLRMISNNIGQISYLNALRFGLKRIFFGGFFIRGHEYTMDTISVAVQFWSNGEAKAMFLRHEGFIGALGAFTS